MTSTRPVFLLEILRCNLGWVYSMSELMSAHHLGLGVRTPEKVDFLHLEIAGWLCSKRQLPTWFFHDVFETSRQFFMDCKLDPNRSLNQKYTVGCAWAPQLHGSFQWLIISLVVVNSSPTPSAYPPKRIISPPRSSILERDVEPLQHRFGL